jgi:hypothetical protein
MLIHYPNIKLSGCAGAERLVLVRPGRSQRVTAADSPLSRRRPRRTGCGKAVGRPWQAPMARLGKAPLRFARPHPILPMHPQPCRLLQTTSPTTPVERLPRRGVFHRHPRNRDPPSPPPARPTVLPIAPQTIPRSRQTSGAPQLLLRGRQIRRSGLAVRCHRPVAVCHHARPAAHPELAL